ncbi:MAG: hypothetical protein ACPHIA_00345 [Alphaproteobacteria bacterium]
MARPPLHPVPRRRVRKPPADEKMTVGLWWVVGMLFLAMVSAFALSTVVILIIGMLPAWVALIVDRNPSKAAGKSVMSLNLVGITPYLIDLWVVGQAGQMDKAYTILTDPFTWLVMYGSAAVGWIIYLGMPHIIAIFIEMRVGHRKAQLAKLRKEIIEEWGEEIAGAIPRRGE